MEIWSRVTRATNPILRRHAAARPGCGEQGGSRRGEPALRRLAIGVVARLCAFRRLQLSVELRHPKVIEGSEHRARLPLGRVAGLARLRDPLRQHGGAAGLHLMEMLADLADRPATFDGTGLPAVAGNGGCDVEQQAALRRQTLGNLGQSRMHRTR